MASATNRQLTHWLLAGVSCAAIAARAAGASAQEPPTAPIASSLGDGPSATAPPEGVAESRVEGASASATTRAPHPAPLGVAAPAAEDHAAQASNGAPIAMIVFGSLAFVGGSLGYLSVVIGEAVDETGTDTAGRVATAALAIGGLAALIVGIVWLASHSSDAADARARTSARPSRRVELSGDSLVVRF